MLVKLKILGVITLKICLCSWSFAQQGHSYPRTACFTWGGAPAEWYAKFDLVDFGGLDKSDLAKAIKLINPNIWIIQTYDWNASAHAGELIPEPFQLKLADGENIGLYYSDYIAKEITQWGTNFTKICPECNGQRGYEWFADFIINRTNLSIFDGISTDGCFGGIWAHWRCPDNVDFDRNNKPDRDEHGKEWIENTYVAGIKKLKEKMRERIGNKLMVINSGMGFEDHPDIWKQNGAIIEYYGTTTNYDYEWGTYKNFMAKARDPQASIFLAQPEYRDTQCPKDSKNYYQFMRFSLAKCMMGNGYYHFEPTALREIAEHYYNIYYDEFGLDIGCPIGESIEIKDGIWVRYFDSGVVLLNVNSNPVIITAEELNGIYYKFKGGQCPEVNTGELAPFESIELMGHNFTSWSGMQAIVGDGIILVKTPTICIADIIIDNQAEFTSPGQSPASLIGEWEQVAQENSGWALRVSVGHKLYSHAKGSGQVTYNPIINVPGNYEIFEWNDGWKSIGIEYLDGNYMMVESGENIIADAVMFRYIGDDEINYDMFWQWLSLVLMIGG